MCVLKEIEKLNSPLIQACHYEGEILVKLKSTIIITCKYVKLEEIMKRLFSPRFYLV